MRGGEVVQVKRKQWKRSGGSHEQMRVNDGRESTKVRGKRVAGILNVRGNKEYCREGK